jgi:hypothetical protein
MHDSPRLPKASHQLPALLEAAALDLPGAALAATGDANSSDLAQQLAVLADAARDAARLCLAAADPDSDEGDLAVMLTLRAWLLAVAASTNCTAKVVPDPAAGQQLRDRYADDLRAARIDGVLDLIDDVLGV